jgi:hypothetical protein
MEEESTVAKILLQTTIVDTPDDWNVARTAQDRELSNMSDERRQLDRRQPIIQALIEEHVRVSADIIPIDGNTWAIHGLIAVDGDVLMAEFDSPDEAAAAIEEIRTGLAEAPGPMADGYTFGLGAPG